jgi:hypothetical protein
MPDTVTGSGFWMNNKIKFMKKFLDVFFPLLKDLNDSNLFLTGMNALKSHGLIVQREPLDLDVAIHKPTEKQKHILEILKPLSEFHISNERTDYENNVISNDIKIIKFKRKGIEIDIFTTEKEGPQESLLYNYNGTMFNVSPIDEIIKAKASYGRQYINSLGNVVNLKRAKDVIDLQDLKNSNFNF